VRRGALIAAIGAAAIAAGSAPHLDGSARLIAFEPVADAVSCEWTPEDEAQAQSGAIAASTTRTASAAANDEVASRKPLRWIQDPNASFSSVAVDAARDEVVLLDANRFDIMVFDRLANTPASQPRTEPKRRIGGAKTLSQFASTLHIDAANGDIYAVNNDSLRGMNVFPRAATGDVAPLRHFDAPYGSYGLAVDDEKQEMFITIQHDSAVGVWPKSADGKAVPMRSLQGDRTGLADPHSIALDLKNRLIYVVNFGTSRLAIPGRGAVPGAAARIPFWPAGTHLYRQEVVPGTGKFGMPSVTVYPIDAQGNVAPLRTIRGSKTGLSWPTGVSVDPERGEVYVANDTGDAVTVYSATANGDVAPVRTLRGPKSLIKNPLGVFVDAVHDEVWVANYGNHTATVYRRSATGDAAPLRVIRSAPPAARSTLINNPYAIAYDPTRQQILVPSCVQHPRIAAFARMADTDAAATRVIQGQNTLLNRTVHGIKYNEIHDEIVVNSNIGQAVLTYRGGAEGDEAPIRVIQGPSTQLVDPVSVAIDQVHDEIFVFQRGPASRKVLVFERTAKGDAAPKRVLNVNAGHGAVDPIHNLLILPGGGGLLVFDRIASGDAQPRSKITGPNAGLRNARAIEVYPPTGKIIVNVGGGGEDVLGGDYVGVWSIEADGDVRPEWTIGKGILKQMRGLTLDPANRTVMVSDKYYNGVLTFALPEMFAAVADERVRMGVPIPVQ
jgi:DNA-binding beta-propeller fold protein YncE